MDKPLISVIIPVFKVEKYLEKCLNSILSQTYQNIEVILVDDGTPDKCGSVCDLWAFNDERITVIHKSNGGLSSARNAGMLIAKGEYISFVDSDDYIENNMFELLISVIDKTDADIAECERDFVYDDDQQESKTNLNESQITVCSAEDALELNIKDDIFRQTVWNKIYKRSVIKHIVFEVGKISEDEFWTYQILGQTNKVAHIDNICYHYRQRADSIMNSKYSKEQLTMAEAKLQRLKYIKNYFPQLTTLAKVSVLEECRYQAQFVVRFLLGTDKKESLEELKNIQKSAKLSTNEWKSLGIKRRMWIFMSVVSLQATAKIKNIREMEK